MKTSENDRAICCFQQNGEKEGKKKRWFIFPADLGSLFVVMIIISESPCDTWECIRSSIFFMHPSILTLILYLYLHWTYSWIISISFPLAPVKQRLAQVATRHLSDLDSWITASLSASREKRKEKKKERKTDFYLLGLGTAASACKLWTFVTEQYITDQMVWNQRRERVSINPTKTPFKVLSVLWSLCGLMCGVEISGSWESGCLPDAFVWAQAWLGPRWVRRSQRLTVRGNSEPVLLLPLSSSPCHETSRLWEKTDVTAAMKSLVL